MAKKLKYFEFKGRHYRWRDWPSCGDERCGCGQARGEHEFHCSIGGRDAVDAEARLRVSHEDDGCTVLAVELVGEYEFEVPDA